ncbi:MAG TPA: hypothetical protein VK655_11525 [Solirubrobacteraceae bacterium]|nr:hypothetical protein [Solirubrobacteraceae bacterium]
MATLVVSTCAMAALASPVLALTEGFSPWLVCDNNKGSAEVLAREMGLEPANDATVPAGTPVTFSGESNRPLMFNVASSTALLTSPDIDSGTGSQSGAFYRFTSTKATATLRTIYWTASFTFTPGDCESPSTFTTPVHTLIVAPTAAELAAAKARQEEEEAAKKELEEEATAKKKEEEAAAAGSVVLDGLTIEVENRREATVQLTCSDVATCAGKLTLTASATAGKGKARHAKTESVGTASFSIAAGTRAIVKITLDNTGRSLLSAAHGHLNAALTILRTSPPPNKTQSQHVHLDLKTAKAE